MTRLTEKQEKESPLKEEGVAKRLMMELWSSGDPKVRDRVLKECKMNAFTVFRRLKNRIPRTM